MTLIMFGAVLNHQTFRRDRSEIEYTFDRMILPIDELMLRGAFEKTYASGEVIFEEGSLCSFYFQVKSGRVKWLNFNDEGREYLQSLIGEGESFGELPLFDHKPYAATAIAEIPSVIIKLPIEDFIKLLQENPEYHFRFSELLASRLRFKFLLLKEYAYSSPEKRVETLLTHFKMNNQHLNLQNHQVMLTRQQIADMTGLRVETVIRVIRAMHESNKLYIEKGKIHFV